MKKNYSIAIHTNTSCNLHRGKGFGCTDDWLHYQFLVHRSEEFLVAYLQIRQLDDLDGAIEFRDVRFSEAVILVVERCCRPFTRRQVINHLLNFCDPFFAVHRDEFIRVDGPESLRVVEMPEDVPGYNLTKDHSRSIRTVVLLGAGDGQRGEIIARFDVSESKGHPLPAFAKHITLRGHFFSRFVSGFERFVASGLSGLSFLRTNFTKLSNLVLKNYVRQFSDTNLIILQEVLANISQNVFNQL